MKPENTGDSVLLKLEKEHKKISLGYKQLRSNPWDKLRAAHPEGSVVGGVGKNITDCAAFGGVGGFRKGDHVIGPITRVADCGVFVEIADGVEGLVHISELSREKVASPTAPFQEGNDVGGVGLSVGRT